MNEGLRSSNFIENSGVGRRRDGRTAAGEILSVLRVLRARSSLVACGTVPRFPSLIARSSKAIVDDTVSAVGWYVRSWAATPTPPPPTRLGAIPSGGGRGGALSSACYFIVPVLEGSLPHLRPDGEPRRPGRALGDAARAGRGAIVDCRTMAPPAATSRCGR